MNKHKPTLFLFVLLLISGNAIFAVKTPALLQSIRLPKTIPGKEWGTSLWNKVPNIPSNDAVMRYIWKKTPVRMRTAIENYIQKHPTRYKKAQEVAKKAYPYRYYLMGGLGLLALAGYNRGLISARFNRTMSQPVDVSVIGEGGLGIHPLRTEPRVEFVPIDFNALPEVVKQDQLVQKLKQEYDRNQEYDRYTLGRDDQRFDRTVGELLDALVNELANPAEKELFCRLVRKFDTDKARLNIDDDKQYDDITNPNLFFFSQHPNVQALLDPIMPGVDSPPIYTKTLTIRRDGNENLRTDDNFQETDWGIEHRIVSYYTSDPFPRLNRTFFGTCEGMIIAQSDSDGPDKNRKLFEGTLYKFIKVIVQNPPIIFQLQDKEIVIDYPYKLNWNSYRRLAKVSGVSQESEDSMVYKGKNEVGKVLTYIVQQLLLPENHELLDKIILPPKGRESWNTANRVFHLRKNVAFGPMGKIREFLVGLPAPTPSPFAEGQ